MRYVVLAIALLINCSVETHVQAGQAPSAKGSVELTYKGKLSSEDRIGALRQAKIKALDRYFAEAEINNQRNYEAMRDSIVSNIDDYILSTVTLVDENDDKNKKYTVAIRIDINEARLNNALLNSAAVANVKNGDKSMMTFVFVAREKLSIQSFDDKKYSRNDVTAQVNGGIQGKQQQTNTGAESEHISKSSIQTSNQTDKSIDQNIQAKIDVSQSVTTGGSTIRKADVIEWTVSSTQEIDSIFTGIFSDAGFQVSAAEDVEEATSGLLKTSAFKDDYRRGDDISQNTRSSATKGVKGLGIKYLAVGTLDIGMPDTDPVSGLWRVSVKVTAKMLDVSGPLSTTVASVGPEQFFGIGDKDVARTNALKLAANAAAKKLVNALNAKSVH